MALKKSVSKMELGAGFDIVPVINFLTLGRKRVIEDRPILMTLSSHFVTIILNTYTSVNYLSAMTQLLSLTLEGVTCANA